MKTILRTSFTLALLLLTSCLDRAIDLDGTYVMYGPDFPSGVQDARAENIVAVLTFTPEGRFYYQKVHRQLGQLFDFGPYETGNYTAGVSGSGSGVNGTIEFRLRDDRKRIKADYYHTGFKIIIIDSSENAKYRFEWSRVRSKRVSSSSKTNEQERVEQ